MEASEISVGFAIALVLGIVIPMIRYCTKQASVLGEIQLVAAQLLKMHEEPDAHNFGTKRTNELLEVSVKEHTLLLKQMVHYMRWYVETATGKEPPPFIDLDHK